MSDKNYTFELETITPLHIGSGNSYSSFLIKDGFRLTENKIIERIVEEKLKKIKGTSIDVNQILVSEEEVKRFVDNLKSFDEYKMYKVEDLFRLPSLRNSVTIQEIVKSLNKPIVPGSTLKGAFNTVLLVRYLKEKSGTLSDKDKDNLIEVVKNPQKIEILRNWIPNLTVSDCLPESDEYRVSIGKIKVGRREVFFEFLVNFKGKFSIQCKDNFDIGMFIKECNEFTQNYISNIKKIPKADAEPYKSSIEKIENILKSVKENEAILSLGRFGGFYSKSILFPYLEGFKIKEAVKKPRGLRLVEHSGKLEIPGIVRIKSIK